MPGRFDYVVQRIKSSDYETTPFKFLYIEDIFNESDFSEIVSSREVNIPPANNDEELIDELHRRSFEEIVFPGTTTDVPTYLKWHKDPTAIDQKKINSEITQGFGLTLRLKETSENSILNEVNSFFDSTDFLTTIADKFDVRMSEVYPDKGLQKYLDGYEISPHPDIRRKALTYMINVNPGENSEDLDIHTHYMRLKPNKAYVQTFWEANTDVDTCWVPWDWCETARRQTANNSMVIFKPSTETMHAVRASYDHLATQRTQFYGNLWFNKPPATTVMEWSDLVITPSNKKNLKDSNKRITDMVPFKGQLKSLRNRFR